MFQQSSLQFLVCAFFAMLSSTSAAPTSTTTLEKRRRGGGGGGGGGGGVGRAVGAGGASLVEWEISLIIIGSIIGTGLIICLVYWYWVWIRRGAKFTWLGLHRTTKTTKVSEAPKLSWKVKTGFENLSEPEQVWVLRRSTWRQ